MSRWKENTAPLPSSPRGAPNPYPVLPCKRPLQSPSPCPPPRRPLADVTGNALEQRGGGEPGGYGYATPLQKVPRPCEFLLGDDDDMDEAFLREVDAICEEHARSTARKEKEKEKKLAEENNRMKERPPAVAAAMIDDAAPEIATVRHWFHDGSGNGGRNRWGLFHSRMQSY